MHLSSSSILFSVGVALATAQCFDPSPAFPVPSWGEGGKSLQSTFESIENHITGIISKEEYNASSFSIELTSASETIWSMYHTARRRNESRLGTEEVGPDSVYRMSAVTKVFTVLGLLYQHETGNLSLEDSISKYIPELSGDIQWDKITLRALASHLSGVPREFAHSDMINQFQDPTKMGLPPTTKEGCPTCDEYNDYLPCTKDDLIKAVNNLKPVFAPNEKSTYSNVAFELIGMALENVTGRDFSTYLQETIFDPLGMSSTSMNAPTSDKNAVLPIWSKGDNYWGIDAGVQNSTAGLYTSSSDMSKFLQYILTNSNEIVNGVNWFMPGSWSTSFRTFYGMPWEILRTEKVLKDSNRPVTFVSKSGGMPGYYSQITLMPEYGLGLTILVGGETGLLSEIQELVTTQLIREADPVLWRELSGIYDGTYVAVDDMLDSSVTISSEPSKGMKLTSFISNGTDVLERIFGREASSDHWHAQLVPTMLFRNAEKRRGEIWKFIIVPEPQNQSQRIWDDLCGTDVDTSRYAGIPANEFVFWHDEGVLELPAWKVKMAKSRSPASEHGEKLVVQEQI